MNNSDKKKAKSPHFEPAVGSTVTYGVALFLALHVLGLFFQAFDWVWHLPSIIGFLGALALGTALHWLVFTMGNIINPPGKEDKQ